MRAVQVVEPGRIEVAEVPEPEADGLVTIRTRLVGICGTDTKILAGNIPVEYPKIAGHELIGDVVSAPERSPYEPGMRVLVDPAVACGWCDLCVAGRPQLCRNGGLMGRDIDGAFAELVAAPLERVLPVPVDMPLQAAGVLQVLGTCIHAVDSAQPRPGKVAAVIGLGVAGQLISQLLSAAGMYVVGITRSEWKRDLAMSLGAADVADPGSASETLDELTQGRGPDLVVEAVGKESTLSQAVELVSIGGEIVVFGTITSGSEGLPYYHLYHKELTLHNPRAALRGNYADGIALAAAGKLQLEPIVTHTLSLEEAPKAFELVNDASSLKVLMRVA